MSAERRTPLKLVPTDARHGASPGVLAGEDGEAVLSLKSLIAALWVALVVAAVSVFFFFWLPVWVHGVVFGATFIAMLAFGRSLATMG